MFFCCSCVVVVVEGDDCCCFVLALHITVDLSRLVAFVANIEEAEAFREPCGDALLLLLQLMPLELPHILCFLSAAAVGDCVAVAAVPDTL